MLSRSPCYQEHVRMGSAAEEVLEFTVLSLIHEPRFDRCPDTDSDLDPSQELLGFHDDMRPYWSYTRRNNNGYHRLKASEKLRIIRVRQIWIKLRIECFLSRQRFSKSDDTSETQVRIQQISLVFVTDPSMQNNTYIILKMHVSCVINNQVTYLVSITCE